MIIITAFYQLYSVCLNKDQIMEMKQHRAAKGKKTKQKNNFL